MYVTAWQWECQVGVKVMHCNYVKSVYLCSADCQALGNANATNALAMPMLPMPWQYGYDKSPLSRQCIVPMQAAIGMMTAINDLQSMACVSTKLIIYRNLS